jgi:hypothetical protein
MIQRPCQNIGSNYLVKTVGLLPSKEGKARGLYEYSSNAISQCMLKETKRIVLDNGKTFVAGGSDRRR